MGISSGKIATQIHKLIKRWQPSSDVLFLTTALVVGVATGAWAVLFRYLIKWNSYVFFEWIPEVTKDGGKAYIVLVPAFGGLLVGLLIHYFAKEAKGAGVPEVMEAVALKSGFIRPRVILVKTLASSITIGSGGSAGREGPIVQIGSAIGSLVGQVLKLSENRVSNLVACGSASGIAAAFNAPIAGVIFALEVILGRFYVRYFSSVVIAAVAASVIGRVAFGDAPAFSIPFEYQINSLWEFVFYLILGGLGAVVGVTFTRALYRTESAFAKIKNLPEWLKPAVGGFFLGVLGLLYANIHPDLSWEVIPQVFGVGYETLEIALASKLALFTAVSLLILKIISTSLTIGSGGSGGIFAPSLFIGALLGTSLQMILTYFFPGIPAPAGAYALLGMAAVFASISKAPMAAMMMMFELTGNYHIILPLMIVIVVSTSVGQSLMNGESIYSLKLLRRGIRIKRGQDTDILENVAVSEVLTKNPETVSYKVPYSVIPKILAKAHTRTILVLDKSNKLYGVVTLTDIEKAVRDGVPSKTPVQKIATTWPHILVTYADEAIGDALPRMSARGIASMPVVSREDPYQVVGLLKRRNILRAYNLAITKRKEYKKKQETIQHLHHEANELVEIPLGPNDNAIGKSVVEIAKKLPKDCILVSIKRGGHLIMPHGDTVFQVGDVVTAFVTVRESERLFDCLHGGSSS